MAISACLRTISKDFEYDQSQPVKVNLLSEYERVIVESLITSFGLDALLVKDQYGGDVDTVHNVDKIINPNSTMEFKNKEYAEAYDRLKKQNIMIRYANSIIMGIKNILKLGKEQKVVEKQSLMPIPGKLCDWTTRDRRLYPKQI